MKSQQKNVSFIMIMLSILVITRQNVLFVNTITNVHSLLDN